MPIQNLINQGQAQVLNPGDTGVPDVIQQLQRGDEQRFQRDRLRRGDAEKRERELYGLIGDSLNPKDFNSVIQDRVLKAQRELANKIKTENPSYADTYMMAQNMAGQLGKTSQALNRLDQQIALTKKEYEQDKRINSGAVELAARKRIMDQLNQTGTVDDSVNYFDDALNSMPEIGLVDNSDITFTDFKPEERQPLKYNVRKKNSVGRTNQYTWEMDNYPSYYDVKQNGDYEPPTIKVKSEPSGIKDASGNEMPMLSADAYKRFSLTPSNVVALNRRIKRNNPDINLNSREAETLRRVEAYKEAERNKPVPRESRVETEPKAPTININLGAGNNTALDGNEFDRIESLSGKPDGFYGVDHKQIPASVSAILKSAGYDISDATGFDVQVKDGKIESIEGVTEDGQTMKKITRQDMENAQLKYNTEPRKGPQIKYGPTKAAAQRPGTNGQTNKQEDLRSKYNY